MKENLTPEELAERWNITTQTLDQWRWSGRGPVFIKIGRGILYSPEDIAAFEHENRYRNTSQRKKMQREARL